MKTVAIAVALTLSASCARAEAAYNAEFVAELRALDRGQEAFQYALTWAASGDPKAEIEVAFSLLEGRGIESDPMAAMRFACGPRQFGENDLRKVLIKGNLRLAGTGAEIVRCASMSGEE